MKRKKGRDIVKRKWGFAALIAIFLTAGLVVGVLGTTAEMYFASDKNGENRVTKIQEGDEIWIVVYDPDEDQDCDVRDKVWTEVKVMDAKTGAHIVWESYVDSDGIDTDGDGKGDGVKFGHPDYVPHRGHWPGASAGWTGADFLEETNSATGLFVSSRPFQIGTRVAYTDNGQNHAHIVGPYDGNSAPGSAVTPRDFVWGGYMYADADTDTFGDDRVWVNEGQGFVLATTANPVPAGAAYLPAGAEGASAGDNYMLGRFENMDTILGLYVDPNDAGDVAITQGKIIDIESVVEWDQHVYPDGNEAATIIVRDADENLHCGKVETVPVFVLVNPGSWNPVVSGSGREVNDFCSLKRYGGVVPGSAGDDDPSNAIDHDQAIVWHNTYYNYVIYPGTPTTGAAAWFDLRTDGSRQPNEEGTYYVRYPNVNNDPNGQVLFATSSDSGVTRVMFYATETSADSGVFEVRLNSILRDLGFDELNIRDVLVAYYVDPNDQDDFSLATAYIHEYAHSTLRFTDHARNDEDVFWIGRDPVYVEVVDANANTDSCCPEQVVVHVCDPHEVDDVEWLILDELSSNSPVFFTHIGMKLVSVWDAIGIGDPGAQGGYSLHLDNWALEAFNEDSIYARYNDIYYEDAHLAALGDATLDTMFPPRSRTIRVANDVSFAVFEVGDTQVFDGDRTEMFFLDRNGNRVEGYVNSDCVFIQVIDPDQDEDQHRRERVAAYWDGDAGAGQNMPLGPMDFTDNHDGECGFLDTKTHLVNTLLGDTNIFSNGEWSKVFILNPRNGRWAAVDLMETDVASGTFVSVACVDLVSQYDCAPNLGVLPGDTILASYQDPSNHSDMAWISIKVGIGGGGVIQGSTTAFTDAEGNEVAAYLAGESLYVRVDDSTVAGAGTLPDAVTIDGVTYDLAPLPGGPSGAFITRPIDLGAAPGDEVEAVYVDPSDPSDTSSATVQIVAGQLQVERFYASPSPFSDVTTFAYVGEGMADQFAVSVYDLRGHLVWRAEEANTLSVDWDGRNRDGEMMANGAYIYIVAAVGSQETFNGKGTVFLHR